MRHGRSQGGIVVQHEYADVFGFVDVPACAPCPVAKLETPQSRRDWTLRWRAPRRKLVQLGSESGPDGFAGAQLIAGGLAREETVDGLEAFDVQIRHVARGHR